MSFLRSKHSGWGPDGRRTPFMGGGGGGSPAPTQTTSYSTNVPEYARPYVENMLESTQKQIYTDDMAGFRPYRPYSTDVNQYFAGFSPMQQQAQQATANLQTPGQYGTATGLAGMSGMGGLGLAGQMAGAGQQYAQQATNPNAVQSYMSPYMQNVVDYQKMQAVRDYQMAAPMRARAAVGAGAFGGSRQAIESAEAQRNLMSQLQGIEGQGRQSAFQQAQQAQQFGANLGLQGQQGALGGLGAATQAAGALGQLGGQQLGAQKEIIGLQSQMGREQQALEQNKINQAIQDYAIAQQYPFMQLGMMNAMLRGLPMQTQTTQLYQAQPSMLQQGIGLAGAAGSLMGGGRAAGGAIKEYRQGGIVGYAPGGVIDSTRAQLEQIADMPGGVQKLEQIRNSSTSDEVRKMAAEIIIEKQMEARAEQQTQKDRMSGIALAGGPAFESQSMAGGGIIAFAGQGPSVVEDPEERAKKQLEEDRAALLGGGKALGSSAMDILTLPNRAIAGVLNTGIRGARAVTGANIPYIYGDNPSMTESLTPYYDKNVRKPAMEKAAAEKEQKDLDQFDEATRRFEEERAAKKTSTAQTKEGAAATEGTSGKAGTAAAKSKEYKDFLAELKEAGPKGQAGAEYEKYLTERLGKSGERLSRDERMAMAKGFLKFASTPAPGGIMQAAAAGLGEYATGIEGARKAQDTMEAEAQKARMELDKARRAEERGDAAGAREAYEKYQDRINRLQASQISAGAAGASQRYTEQQIQKVMAENPGMSYGEAMTRVAGAGRMESVEVQRAKAALASIDDSLGLMGKKDPRRAELEAQRAEIIRLLTPGGGVGGGQGQLPQGVTVKKVG
jgi:hypothetical protein